MVEAQTTFTPVERRMLKMLADGLPHTPLELHGCLHDDLAAVDAVRGHILNLRRKLQPKGENIVCELFARRFHYRHVKLLGE